MTFEDFITQRQLVKRGEIPKEILCTMDYEPNFMVLYPFGTFIEVLNDNSFQLVIGNNCQQSWHLNELEKMLWDEWVTPQRLHIGPITDDARWDEFDRAMGQSRMTSAGTLAGRILCDYLDEIVGDASYAERSTFIKAFADEFEKI